VSVRSGTIVRVPVLFIVLILAVLAAVALVAAGRGDSMVDAQLEREPFGLPEEPLDAAALRELRFAVAFRGYRMDEVDAVLDRLVGELARRDERIAELERPTGDPAASEPEPGEDEFVVGEERPGPTPVHEA
jgi:DivIVA domain-containing protein